MLLSLLIEARMLFKIKAVRCDLRKFSGSARFLIILNLKKLPDCGNKRGAASAHAKSATFKARMLLKTNEARNNVP